jgi:hypothetical protein
MSESKIPYDAMNASEKTKYIGFKIFSDRELKDRQKKAIARRTAATKKFLEMVLSNPELELGSHLDGQKLEAMYKDAINNFFDQGVHEGLTTNDLEGVMNNIISIAYMFKRTMNEAATEAMRLNYALTGENAIADVPLKEIMQITKVAAEMRPPAPSEYDDEPSLGQTADEPVSDVVPAEEAK